VKLINTNGLALIGPGSAWFWSALTVVALSTTFFAVYRQLRAQHAANAFEQLQTLTDQWYSERMRHLRLRLALALQQGDDPDTEFLAASVASFFDRLDFLHRRGYLATEVLFSSFGEDVVRWWTVMGGPIAHWRSEYGAQEVAGFERLAGEMRALMAQRGIPEFKTDPASVAERLHGIVVGQTQALRIEREIQLGVIPTEAVALGAAAASPFPPRD